MQLNALQNHFMACLLEGGKAEEWGWAIYRNNRRETLIKALANVYPVCQRLVGLSCFRAIASRYIQKYPSSSPNLDDYGAFFSKWISKLPLQSELPYLCEVAELEWIIHTLLVFKRPNHKVLVQFQYPVDKIWEVNQAEFPETIYLSKGKVHLKIWRTETELKISRLP